MRNKQEILDDPVNTREQMADDIVHMERHIKNLKDLVNVRSQMIDMHRDSESAMMSRINMVKQILGEI